MAPSHCTEGDAREAAPLTPERFVQVAYEDYLIPSRSSVT